jgi:esterase/lipase
LHGYTATRKEVEPLPQLLAAELEANLYLNRLTGHGQKKHLFKGVTYKDWLHDVEKDLEVAEQLGDEIIILAVSTGATLATYLVNKYPKKIKSVIYLSALFGPADTRSELLTIPIIGSLLRKKVLGKYRSWKPANEGQAKYWKHYYLSTAVTQLVRLVQKVRRLPLKKFTTPSCWLYNPEDNVVSVKKLLKSYKKWGGKKSIISVESNDHVIAGDIMNPELTMPVLNLIKDNCFLN